MANTIKRHLPLVTVYMPVFNASAYLGQAIESILSQTYTYFEFIIIDDASTDKSWKIIQKYAARDHRIRAYKNHLNLGVSLTSNIAIKLAKGKFLARMDADDISLPDRLGKQVYYLQDNPDTVAIGGQCLLIDKDNQIIGDKTFPTDPEKLEDMIFWAIPMQQPTMMVNLTLLPKRFTWYNRNRTSAEEVDLMFRFLDYGYIANLPDHTLYYRHLDNSLSRKNPKLTFRLTLQSRLNAVRKGYTPSLTGWVMNLAQIFAITILPSKFIYDLWYLIRGTRSVSVSLGPVALSKVKSN